MIPYIKILELAKSWLPILEKHWKTLLFIIVSILAILFYLRGEKFKKRAEDAEAGRDAAIKISNGLSSEFHKYRNKQGDTVTVTKAIGIPKDQVDELIKQNDLKWLKKFDDSKPKDLQSAQTFGTSFIPSLVKHDTIYLKCKDSVKATKYEYNDAWNHISALAIGKPVLEIRDRYYAVIELKRPKHWFFKFLWSKREAYGEITNSNKLIRVDSAAVITVK